MNTKKIVISGISSGLGISLAKLLVAKGYFVVGFSRNVDKVAKVLLDPKIELRSGDIRDPFFTKSICSGAYGVVHLAALSSPWGKYSDFYEINVDGTRLLTKGALESDVSRFVHVSTPSLYFDFQDKHFISEAHPLPKKGVNFYAQTKKMAEDVVDDAVEKGLEAITIRPRAIFGPHDQTLFPRLLQVCQKSGIPQFRKESPIVDISYVDNVAHALILALEASPKCIGQKYNITNAEPAYLYDLLEDLLSKLSIPHKVRKIPYPIAYLGAWVAEALSRFTGKEPILTRYMAGVLACSQTLDIRKARSELNYQPIVSLSEGINRYAQWLQNN